MLELHRIPSLTTVCIPDAIFTPGVLNATIILRIAWKILFFNTSFSRVLENVNNKIFILLYDTAADLVVHLHRVLENRIHHSLDTTHKSIKSPRRR